jgi:hypothetical protein
MIPELIFSILIIMFVVSVLYVSVHVFYVKGTYSRIFANFYVV